MADRKAKVNWDGPADAVIPGAPPVVALWKYCDEILYGAEYGVASSLAREVGVSNASVIRSAIAVREGREAEAGETPASGANGVAGKPAPTKDRSERRETGDGNGDGKANGGTHERDAHATDGVAGKPAPTVISEVGGDACATGGEIDDRLEHAPAGALIAFIGYMEYREEAEQFVAGWKARGVV